MSDKIKKLEQRREKIDTGEEYENFKTLIDDTRRLFNPDIATLQTQVAKGTKLNKKRVSDAGISMNNDYASGVLAETITAGDEWFEMADRKKEQADADTFDGMTKIMFDHINHSNFYSEMHRDQRNAGCDGTVCMHIERVDGKLNFIHTPFGAFWFRQDFWGKPDTVWVEKTTTVGALAGEFGVEKLSSKSQRAFKKTPDEEIKIIYYCAKRTKRDPSKKDDKNKAYELLIYEKEENHELREGGTDLQKFMVYRVKRILDETLGRGPCIDTVSSMAALERNAKDLQRGLRLAVVPVYGVAASMGQKGFRMIHQDDASIMVYDDTGIASPPQTMNPPVNVDFGLKYMELITTQMHKMFFLDHFNPVQDKKNITAFQTREIVNKSQQMVSQIVEPFNEERVDPALRWIMVLLGEAGLFSEFGSWEEIQKEFAGRVTIRHKSRLANAQKRIRLLSIVEYTEMKAVIAQGIPDPVQQFEFMAQTDWTKVPQELINGTNAPQTLLLDPEEAKAKAKEFAEGLAQQSQMDNMVKGADAAAKASGAVDPTSVLANA